LAGLALTTGLSAIDAEAAVATAATAMLRPSATSTVRSVRLLNGTKSVAPCLTGLSHRGRAAAARPDVGADPIHFLHFRR
jgi:hypothetical protein